MTDTLPAGPPVDGIRDQLLHAIDHAYTTGVLGYTTPEDLLAAYDTSRAPVPSAGGHTDDTELTAEEARTLADDLGLQLYRAQDALAFVAECCDIADREQRTVTTADVREWLKGARCGRQLAADATGRGDCPDLDAIAARAADAQQYGIEDDGFEQLVREDVPALITALRRMADETATTQTQAAGPVCICGHPEERHFEDVCQTCECSDYLEPGALPDTLEAVLTKRYTELGNPFSEMRRREQGPDGWPASHPVGPHHVAETLRELLRRAATDGPGLRLPDHTVNEEETPAPRDRHRAAWNALTPQQQAAYLAQLDSAGARQDQTTTDEPERCAHCTHPKRDHDGRADHRAKHSPLVAGDPWCHACDGPCDYAAGARQDDSWPVKEATRRYAAELRATPGKAAADGYTGDGHTGWECDAGAQWLVAAETPRPGRVATHHGTIYACPVHRSTAVERITGAGYEADPQPAPPGHRWNPWPCGHVTAHGAAALTALTATERQDGATQ